MSLDGRLLEKFYSLPCLNAFLAAYLLRWYKRKTLLQGMEYMVVNNGKGRFKLENMRLLVKELPVLQIAIIDVVKTDSFPTLRV